MRGLALLIGLVACQAPDLDVADFACSDSSECDAETVCLFGRCGPPAACGDGIRNQGEACDDGAALGEDGCRNCQIQEGWRCLGAVGALSVCNAIRYREVSAGKFHLCLLDDQGFIECRGNDLFGQRSPPNELGPFHGLAGGWNHSCAIRDADDALVCWGENEDELGAGKATPPADLGPVRGVAAGEHHTCAITTAGPVRCWGAINGRTGEPNPIPPSVVATEVRAGRGHTCVRDADDMLQCWGDPDYFAGLPAVPVQSFSIGFFHTCAVDMAGAISCFGFDHLEVGRTIPPRSSQPFVDVVSGRYHNCALTEQGDTVCSGTPRDHRDWDQNVPPSEPFIGLSSGAYYVCGLRADNTVNCWGHIDGADA